MNSLAHAYLSGSDEHIIVGNFIGDFVKGNSHTLYPTKIQKGILLHRSIDSFTDNSPIVKESKQIFRPIYGKYSGIIVDIVYDHLLSVNWHTYSHGSRELFIQYIYTCLLKYYEIAPLRAKQVIPSLVFNNWMRYYASFYGLEKVLQRMSNRTSLPQQTTTCIMLCKQHYSTLNSHFLEFFPTIRQHVGLIAHTLKFKIV